MENNKSAAVKSNSKVKYLALIVLLLLIILIIKWCYNKKDQVKYSIATKSPIAISFLDAGRMLQGQVGKAKVTLIDPDSMVVTSNGLTFREIEVSGGVMCLALRQNAVYSDTMPYRFGLKIEIDGYSSTYRNFLVTSDEGKYVPIFMARLDDPASGMATMTGTAQLSNGVVSSNLTLKPLQASGVSDTNLVKVQVQKGTRMIFCGEDQNHPAPKKLNYKISYASPLSLIAGRTFPGGPLVTDAISRSGTVIARPAAPFYFTSQGWINIEFDADGTQVESFSKPLIVTLPIPDSLTNPLTSPLRFYQSGDTIPIWSLTDQGVWMEESVAKVGISNGKLVAQMTVTHLSTWNLDCTQSPCSTDLLVNYNNPNATTVLYSELVRASNGTFYGITGLGDNTDFKLTYNNGSGGANHQFSISRAPSGEQAEFITYDNSSAPGTGTGATATTGILARTGVFTINCASPVAPALNLPANASLHQVDLQFSLSATENLCGNAVWYKTCPSCDAEMASEANYCDAAITSGSLQYGGIINKSDGTVTFYKTGVTGFNNLHCLRLWYAESVTATTVVSQPIDFPINFSNQPPVANPRTIYGKNGAGATITLSHWYTGGVHHIRVISGLTTLVNTCI